MSVASVTPIPSQPHPDPDPFRDTARLLASVGATPEMLLAYCGPTPGITAVAAALRKELGPVP